MISRTQLREWVIECLGEGMDQVTPDRIRALLDCIQAALAEPPPGGRFVLDEAARADYREILREFFWRMLHAPSDEAAVRLWIAGFEACFGEWADTGGLTKEAGASDRDGGV